MAYNIANNKVMTEAEKTAALSKCTCGKSADFKPIVWNLKEIPSARVADRMQHSFNLNVMTTHIDDKNKLFVYEVACNGNPDHKTVSYTFDEVCTEFGWRDFVLTNNTQTIEPKW